VGEHWRLHQNCARTRHDAGFSKKKLKKIRIVSAKNVYIYIYKHTQVASTAFKLEHIRNTLGTHAFKLPALLQRKNCKKNIPQIQVCSKVWLTYMYIHICLYMYTCMCVCIYTYVYIHMYVYLCIYINMYIYLYIYID
jgi:hypothetical protein